MVHYINDWLEMHNVNTDDVADITSAYQSGSVEDSPFDRIMYSSLPEHPIEIFERETALRFFVAPALAEAFGSYDKVRKTLERVKFARLSPDAKCQPCTTDNGPGLPPVVAMDWRGTVGDLMCLAHEAAHALQIAFSKHEFMPPLGRETCAFLGELLLLEHARKHDAKLFDSLRKVWDEENERYLGLDLDALLEASQSSNAPYDYRQNYPIARLAAVRLFMHGPGEWLEELFSSGGDVMRYLPLEEMANEASTIANYLPVMPVKDADYPAVDSYRSLGAMSLLDIDFWQGESEKSIGDYYSGLLEHMRDQTAYVALRKDNKPLGYATWTSNTGTNRITITRQSAPFGDHLELQRALERRLQATDGVMAQHRRSAQREQIAW